MTWANDHHRTNAGKVMTFGDARYLVPLYGYIANHGDVVFQKATQCRVSEMFIVKIFCDAITLGLATMYVLPSTTTRSTFVQNRIDRVIQQVPSYQKYYESSVGEAKSVSLKHLGNGVIKFIGSNAQSDFGEFPADQVVIDEIDRCTQEHLPEAKDRMDASDYRWYYEIGNPTTPNRGSAASYSSDQCDQREWNIKCERCGEKQPLAWDVNVVRRVSSADSDDPLSRMSAQYELIDRKWEASGSRDINVYCRKCHKPMDRFGEGEWVPQYRGRPRLGVHISKLFASKKPLSEIWTRFKEGLVKPRVMETCINNDLGLPFSSGKNHVSGEMIRNCIGDHEIIDSYEPGACLGVDVGGVLNCTVSIKPGDGVRRVLSPFTVDTFEELDGVMKRFNVQGCVIDALPETHKAREFQSRHRGKVYLCYYSEKRRTVDRKNGEIKVDRTEECDNVWAQYNAGLVRLPRGVVGIDSWEDQMSAPHRTWNEEREKYIWDKGGKADHYFHSDLYSNLACDLPGQEAFIEVGTTNLRDLGVVGI